MKRLHRLPASFIAATPEVFPHVMWRVVHTWLILSLLLAGCTTLPSGVDGRTPHIAASGSPSDTIHSSAEADQIPVAPILYPPDPLALRKEMTATCASPRAANDRHFLRSLVADLYFSGVEPATGTEALLLGQCGTLSNILSEMIARGGSEHLDAIVARARSISGLGAERQISAAAKAGMARHAMMMDAESSPPGNTENLPAYGMVYFPAAGDYSRMDTAMALNRLYEEAIPGYGIYTFVLVGRAAGGAAARDNELFRVIETYVSTAADLDGPNHTTHAFLVPVSPEHAGGSLSDQVAVDLSEHMRRHLGQSLRRDGQARLAARLEQSAGPFLVSTLEPSLTPADPAAPRLIADLSRLGPEHIYGVIDAYDRPIPPEYSGDSKSLRLIRDRLLELHLPPGNDDSKTKGDKTWIVMLGHFASTLNTNPINDPSGSVIEPPQVAGTATYEHHS